MRMVEVAIFTYQIADAPYLENHIKILFGN
jgi:hypothetical protein